MKKFIRILFVLICVFTLNINVLAEDDIQTNCIDGPEGTNCASPIVIAPAPDIDDESGEEFYADEDVIIKGDHDYTTFAIGKTIDSEADVDGISFYAGGKIKAKGSSDYAFIAGKDLIINEYDIKDGFFAGYNISLKNVFGRTLYIAGDTIEIEDSDFTKLYIAGSTIILKGDFEDVVVASENVIIEGTISGSLRVNENANVEIKEGSEVVETVKYKESEKVEEFKRAETTTSVFVSKVKSYVFKVLNLFIVGVVLIYFCKKAFAKLNKKLDDTTYLFSRIGIGLCVLIVVPILSIIILFTSVGLSLGVISIFAYIAAIMISTPVVAINYGDKLLSKINNDYLRLLASIAIIEIVKLIPIIGGLTSFLVLCLGLGLIKDVLTKEKEEK